MQRSPELMVVRIQMAYTLHGQGRELQALRVLRQAMQDCPANSVDRDRIDGLYNDWLVQLAEDDQRRQRELQRRFGGTSRQ